MTMHLLLLKFIVTQLFVLMLFLK